MTKFFQMTSSPTTQTSDHGFGTITGIMTFDTTIETFVFIGFSPFHVSIFIVLIALFSFSNRSHFIDDCPIV